MASWCRCYQLLSIWTPSDRHWLPALATDGALAHSRSAARPCAGAHCMQGGHEVGSASLVGGNTLRVAMLQLFQQQVQCFALLAHGVVPVVVTRLDPSQSMRLQLAADFPADAPCGKQGLDARTKPLQLKGVDRLAHDGARPRGQGPNADRLRPPGPGRRNRVGTLARKLSKRQLCFARTAARSSSSACPPSS